VGIFLSLGALAVDVIINALKILTKKNGRGMRGFLGLLIVLNICFLFQQYPRNGVVEIFGAIWDVKQYLSLFLLLIGIYCIIRRNKRRFY
jgi:heme/copper-type cytochrome/quinol oxidase subunit 3